MIAGMSTASNQVVFENTYIVGPEGHGKVRRL